MAVTQRPGRQPVMMPADATPMCPMPDHLQAEPPVFGGDVPSLPMPMPMAAKPPTPKPPAKPFPGAAKPFTKKTGKR